ncbi:phosphopantetheine-binding protein [Micromonospora sp. NPDC051925]|uniref:phosphopantetheine-binding protein n=1 Tax=Micromonospora sp. NPDC051925 TaxID=3364288 RepID=UPI0037CC55D5
MTETREEFVDSPYEEPATPLESSVARIAAQVLGVDRIGRCDNLYDFGATSMQAIRICARIEREADCRALPIWLFESDCLADFVGQLQGQGERARG